MAAVASSHSHKHSNSRRKFECAHFSQLQASNVHVHLRIYSNDSFGVLVNHQYHGTQHSVALRIFAKVSLVPLFALTLVSIKQAIETSEGWFQIVDHCNQPLVDQPGFKSI